jgi:hypothetical protein
VDPDIVQPRWDPRDVDDLPTTDALLGLPFDITTPDSAPRLGESPFDSAVLCVAGRGGALLVLASDGQWRSLPAPQDYESYALAPKGSQLAITTSTGVEVWDLPTGRRATAFGLPSGFKPWDYSAVEWVDNETLLLDDMAGGWLVDTVTAEAIRVPYPTQYPSWWTLDPSGAVLESADAHLPQVLKDWTGGKAVEVTMTGTGTLMEPAASDNAIAATTFLGGFGVVVADRSNLTPRALLPLLDHQGSYSNWGLSTIAVRQDGTVLLRVAVIGRDLDGWRMVRWDPKSGSLDVVARSADQRLLVEPTGAVEATRSRVLLGVRCLDQQHPCEILAGSS